MIHRPSLLVLIGLFGVGLAADDAERPNVLWINAEDIGPAFGCYGHPDAITPHVDALAKRGVRYTNAFATAPICAPSRSCLATGLYATTLGTQHLRAVVERPDVVKTLPEHLRRAGYFTASSWKTDYNFDAKGVWDSRSSDHHLWRSWGGPEEGGDKPFFAMITLGVTHEGRVNRTEKFEQAIADLPAELRRDPKSIHLPPYWPDTPRTREIWARQHELITLMDRQVGETLAALDEDGLADETIVVFFADHGYGLPRAKRWLNDSGLRVPLVIAFPEKYRHLAPSEPGSTADELVSFVDFVPTTLALCGIATPEPMQGRRFLGPDRSPKRKYVFGARDRADDMFELSRAVHDGRYVYVRHFLPHLPYIQGGKIFSDEKDSYRELRRLHVAGELPEHARAMWARRKPVEELYDLENDPHELQNLAASKEHAPVLERLRPVLHEWILESRDTGFLNEAEYQIRAKAAGRTPYDVCQDRKAYPLERVLETAEMVGDENVPLADVLVRLDDEDSGVRYWAVTALLARSAAGPRVNAALVKRLEDASPSVRIAAARTLARFPSKSRSAALDTLGQQMLDPRPWVSLEASRAAFELGPVAKPLVPTMHRVIELNRSPPGSSRPWKNFDYAAFTTWSLEAALERVGKAESKP